MEENQQQKSPPSSFTILDNTTVAPENPVEFVIFVCVFHLPWYPSRSRPQPPKTIICRQLEWIELNIGFIGRNCLPKKFMQNVPICPPRKLQAPMWNLSPKNPTRCAPTPQKWNERRECVLLLFVCVCEYD